MALSRLESAGALLALHGTQSLRWLARHRDACLPCQSQQSLCSRWGNRLPLSCCAFPISSLPKGEDGECRRCLSKFSWRMPSFYALVALVVRTSQTASCFAVSFERNMLRRRTDKQPTDDVSGADANDLLATRGGGLCRTSSWNWRFTRRFVSTPSAQRQAWPGGDHSGPLTQMGGLGMTLLSSTAMTKDHIGSFIAILSANPTFMSGLLAWAIAQLLKVFTTFCVERRWDFKMLLESGGMPSSHSALCVALTTSVALCHGLSDSLFPVCLGFSLIVLYDAIGVRRHAGMQAEVLNMIVEILFRAHPINGKKLKELLGHTPLQVCAGALLGMVVGFLCSQGCSAVPGNGI